MHEKDTYRVQTMLERVTDSPVLQSARLKQDLEARFVALLRDAMAQHAAAEELADKRPSRETQERATAGRWLQVLKELIAFMPAAQRQRCGAVDDENDVDELTTRNLELQRKFRKRL